MEHQVQGALEHRPQGDHFTVTFKVISNGFPQVFSTSYCLFICISFVSLPLPLIHHFLYTKVQSLSNFTVLNALFHLTALPLTKLPLL